MKLKMVGLGKMGFNLHGQLLSDTKKVNTL